MGLRGKLVRVALPTLAAGGLGVALVSGAWAQGTGALNRSPSSGPAGTAISVSSKDACTPPGGASAPEVEIDLTDSGGDPVESSTAPVAANGTWSGSITVPDDAAPGSYAVEASCFPSADPNADSYFDYAGQPFQVTAQGGATTTTAPRTTQTTKPPSTAKPPAAVNAIVTFTG